MIQNDLWRIFLAYLPPGNADPSAIDVQLNFVSSCRGNGCHLGSSGHGSQGTCTGDWRLGSCGVRQLWYCFTTWFLQGFPSLWGVCTILIYKLRISLHKHATYEPPSWSVATKRLGPRSSVVMALCRRSRFVIWSWWVGKLEWSYTQNVLNAE